MLNCVRPSGSPEYHRVSNQKSGGRSLPCAELLPDVQLRMKVGDLQSVWQYYGDARPMGTWQFWLSGLWGVVVIGMLVLGLWGGDIGDTRFGIHPR